jgi:hypothetical protein
LTAFSEQYRGALALCCRDALERAVTFDSF